MLRRTLRALEHPTMGAGPSYFTDRKQSRARLAWRRFLSRRWHNFQRRGAALRGLTVAGYAFGGVWLYWCLCMAIHVAQQPTIRSLFYQTAAGIKGGADGDGAARQDALASLVQKDYTLATWEEVEETLLPGDVVFMRGEGPLSWGIVTIQFAYSLLRSPALYYSHVGVVVEPAVYKYEHELTAEERRRCGLPAEAAAETEQTNKNKSSSSDVDALLRAESSRLRSRRVKVRGAVILEGMDNTHYDVRDVGGVARYLVVQRVEAEHRLTSARASADGGPRDTFGYHHCAVRRLTGAARTPEFYARIADFVRRNEGRPVEENLHYPLAFFSPSLYLRTTPAREGDGVVCCGELIAELFEELGLFERHWRWVRLTDGSGAALSPDVDVHRSAAERLRIAVARAFAPPRPADDAAVVARLAALGLPAPTPGDLHPTKATPVPQLHVYEKQYGRAEAAYRTPLEERPRPVAAPPTCIENWQVLADAGLQRQSVEGCDALSDDDRRALLDALNEHRRALPAATGIPAGTVVPTADGGTAQLQYYFAHNTLETMPYTWTQGEAERVFDWASDPQHNFSFVALEETPEGQWLKRRQQKQQQPAMEGAPDLKQIVLVDLKAARAVPTVTERDVAVAAAQGRYVEITKEEQRGPRLGDEIRMQRPRTIHFASSGADEEVYM